jgi:hypothetical protein
MNRLSLVLLFLLAYTSLWAQPVVIKSVKFSPTVLLDDISSVSYLDDFNQLIFINTAELLFYDLNTGIRNKTIQVDKLNNIESFTIYAVKYNKGKYYLIDLYNNYIYQCDENFKILDKINIQFSKAKQFCGELEGTFFYTNELWMPVYSNRGTYEMFVIYNPTSKTFRHSGFHPEISQYPKMSSFLRGHLPFQHPQHGLLVNLPYNNQVYSAKSGKKIGELAVEKSTNLKAVSNKVAEDYLETRQLEESSYYSIQTVYDRYSNLVINSLVKPVLKSGDEFWERPLDLYVYDAQFRLKYKQSNWQAKYFPLLLFSTSKGIIAIKHQSGVFIGFDLLKM